MAIVPPFFPIEAENKGLSPGEYGFVFSASFAASIIFNLSAGAILGKMGPREGLIWGSLVAGVALTLFGLLPYIHNKWLFLIGAIFLRICDALATTFRGVTVMTLITVYIPESVPTLVGFLQSGVGVGLVLGPTLGGYLYQLSGFTPTFILNGSVLLLYTLVPTYLIPKDEIVTNHTSPVTLLHILKLKEIYITMGNIFLMAVGIGFINTTLSAQLSTYNFEKFTIGIVFMGYGVSMMFISPIFGWLINHYMHPRCCLLFGTVLQMISFVLVGPMPILPRSVVLSLIGIILSGIANGAIYTPTYPDCLQICQGEGLARDQNVYSRLSGIQRFFFALGAMIGSAAGGSLFETIGFSYCSLIMFFLFTISTGFLISMIIYICISDIKQSAESVPLLNSEERRRRYSSESC